MNNSASILATPWSSGVEMIAAHEGADRYLLPLVEMTRQLFPAASHLDVVHEGDPDIDDDWRLVFRVEVSLPSSQAAQGIHEWYRQLFSICPPTQACLFRLGLRVTD